MPENKISRHEADALVELIHAARPKWQTAGIRGGIKHALETRPDIDLPELTYACIKVAKDPTYATPAAIAFDGPHWTPPRKPAAHLADTCTHCGGVHTSQAECLPREDDRVDGSDGRTDALRQALQDARTRLCTHGVPHANCAEPHDNSDPVNDSREDT